MYETYTVLVQSGRYSVSLYGEFLVQDRTTMYTASVEFALDQALGFIFNERHRYVVTILHEGGIGWDRFRVVTLPLEPHSAGGE